MPLFWLSFASDQGFLGVALVEVPGPEPTDEDGRRSALIAAIKRAHVTGCNPGGGVQSTMLGAEALNAMSNERRVRLAQAPRDTLLSKEELQHYDLM